MKHSNRTTPLLGAATLAATLAAAAPASAQGQDLIVPAGTVITYQTSNGPLRLRNLHIEAGGTLRAWGPEPLRISASRAIIDGTLDASGGNSQGVVTLNTTNIPEPGAPGVAGGGRGGTGSELTTASTPAGTPGLGSYDVPFFIPSVQGGSGGESCYALGDPDARRAAGGGGGALSVNQPVTADPLAEANRGLVATAGFGGSPMGTGAISGGTSQPAPPVGGAAGLPIFRDLDPDNDFWGERIVGGALVVGEASGPWGGRGGGAGGDACRGATFPLLPFNPIGDEKGAGGGGGGGVVLLLARRIEVGPEGRIRADGGHGGGGENTVFFNRVGGGSGGGSGGWIVLEALEIDLSQAGAAAITALGGRGGPGRNNAHDVVGAGGNGGPGVVQLHTPSGTAAELLLPAASDVGDLTSPDGVVLLPVLGG